MGIFKMAVLKRLIKRQFRTSVIIQITYSLGIPAFEAIKIMEANLLTESKYLEKTFSSSW